MKKQSPFVLLLLFAPILAWSQVTVIQSPTPQFRSFLPSGAPNASGCVYTFTTGTSTPQATYTDFTGNTPNTNPVILDGTGSANIWISSAIYRIQVWSFGSGSVGSNCGNGTQLYQVDGVKDTGLNAFGTGPISVNAVSNGIDIFSITRATDISPSGNFLNFKSFAGVSIFKIDVTGNVIAPSVTLGGGASFTPVTFSNHNNRFWAGPGTTPTIDQAITAANAFTGSMTHISPGYTGADSTNCLLTSLNYTVHASTNAQVVEDPRASTSLSRCFYGFIQGGRSFGALTKIGTTYYAGAGTLADSITASSNISLVGDISAATVLPSNGGAMNGAVSVVIGHDKVTVGTSNSPWVGQDGECDVVATSFDFPVFNCYGINGQTSIIRANGAQSIINGIGLHAAVNSNISSAGGQIINNYGALLEQQSAGVSRNYSLYTLGNTLTANETQLQALDVGTAFTISTITESGQTVTVTTSAPCSLTLNQQVAIAGVTNASYNGTFFVNSTGGCNGGSTFTYFHPAQAALASSSGGTATGSTPRVIAYYRNTNGIDYQPLSDSAGWTWKTQGASGAFRIFPNSAITSLIAHVFNANVNLLNGLLMSNTAPTMTGAGCAGSGASIVVANGTAAFKVNVGAAPSSTCTFTFPTAVTGWSAHCDDITTQSTAVFVQKQIGPESQTNVTIQNFNDVAVGTAFVANDILKCTAFAY